MVAEGDRRQNWEFYQHLWLALLIAPEEGADRMDLGKHGRTRHQQVKGRPGSARATHVNSIQYTGTQTALPASQRQSQVRWKLAKALLCVDGEASGPTWRQSLYTALMRSSLAALHNLDLHYQLAPQPADLKQDAEGSFAGPGDSPVRHGFCCALMHESDDMCASVLSCVLAVPLTCASACFRVHQAT